MPTTEVFKTKTKRKNLFLRVAKGHFATSYTHSNYYIDVADQKSRFSEAKAVAESEGVAMPEDSRIEVYSNDDMWASPASGSARWDSMVIVPSTMGTIGRIASGVSQSLIERAADVMLKERRRLVLVVREAPYSLIHLRNMTTITEAGGIIIPASPSFYFNPQDIESLAATISTRAVEMLGIKVDHKHWGE